MSVFLYFSIIKVNVYSGEMNDYSFITFLKGWENESGFQIGRNGIAETGKTSLSVSRSVHDV
ncbi:unnamed protein product [Bacillus velezensis]|nr:unnamed protein product [Bacillus velezensis]